MKEEINNFQNYVTLFGYIQRNYLYVLRMNNVVRMLTKLATFSLTWADDLSKQPGRSYCVRLN